MAGIRKRGSAYTITVSMGYDACGKQISPCSVGSVVGDYINHATEKGIFKKPLFLVGNRPI